MTTFLCSCSCSSCSCSCFCFCSFFFFFFFFIFFFFFLAYSQRSQIGCLPHFHTSYGLSATLEYRSEMCKRLAGNTGRKNSPSAHYRTTLSGYIFATNAFIDNRQKLLNSHISALRPHNTLNFGPLTTEICWQVWGIPANFNVFRVLASLLHRRRSTEVNRI